MKDTSITDTPLAPRTADLVIRNAAIWSPGGTLPHSAIAIADGRIVALGDESLVENVRAARVHDAAGGLVTPGFVDAHVHAVFAGVEQNRCDLSSCEDAGQAAETIRAYCAAHPGDEWILGGGWRMPWYEGGMPTRQQLDELVPDRPAFFPNADHHGAWVNSRALELAGITAETPDPRDGRIERDATGEPSGTLHEGAAELMSHVLPACTDEELRAGLLAAQQELFAYGVVGWQDAILGEYGGYPDATPVYSEAAKSGELRARVSGALWVSRDFDGLDVSGFVADLRRRRDAYATEGLELSTAKIMVDGVPENETAAMTDPYAGDGCSCGGGTGLAYFTREQLMELAPLLNEAGIDAHFHAIGDRAVEYALDAVAAVPASIRSGRRNHIAHLQVVNPTDIPRFAELGVTANIQALWACRDDQMVDITLGLLGPERSEWQYPFASLARAGARLACGSDWPVSTPDPWQAVHVAVNRREPGDRDSVPLVESEAISLETAITAYTFGAHDLLGFAGGRIEIGAPADLAVADRNPFEQSSAEIFETRNALTVVGGEVVYSDADGVSSVL